MAGIYPPLLLLLVAFLSSRWYADRQEVKAWQELTRANAKKETKCPVYTILGRSRPLPDLV